MAFLNSYKNRTITILTKDGESQNKGTTLPLHALLTGPKTLIRSAKDKSLHIESWTDEMT